MEIGDRMKAYEATFRDVLPVRMPAVIRLDGKAFHSLARNCEKPFDPKLRDCLVHGARAIMEEIPARMAYHQSDEVSLLLVDYNRFDTQQWFGGVVQKMVSVAASMMGVRFTILWGKPGYFDARVFVVPERDIKNYFVWRQRDAMTNAISMAAQAHYSPRELHGKHSGDLFGMLKAKGVDFEAYPSWFSMGSVITRDGIADAPRFDKDQAYLDRFLAIEEE
jgi:tRNA(His) guanylyltransferase